MFVESSDFETCVRRLGWVGAAAGVGVLGCERMPIPKPVNENECPTREPPVQDSRSSFRNTVCKMPPLRRYSISTGVSTRRSTGKLRSTPVSSATVTVSV